MHPDEQRWWLHRLPETQEQPARASVVTHITANVAAMAKD